MQTCTRPVQLGLTPVAAGRWLRLDEIRYADHHGRNRTWESAARQHQHGAVMVIAVLRPSGRYVLVRQYRPPLDRYTLEFPAGLIDPAEPPATTAVRELREETGYSGTISWFGPACYSSPGMTSEFTHIARMDVDENLEPNRNPQTAFDEGEDLEILLCRQAEIPGLLQRQQADGTALDSKLVAFFLGAGVLG